MYWRCQNHIQDYPQEFIVEGELEILTKEGYDVCGGPYAEQEEAEFFLYGGPPCRIQLLDLTPQQVGWLLSSPEYLDADEIDYLNSLKSA